MAKQITDEQRNQIYTLVKAGHKIAKLLHKSPSAISRELKRNQTKGGRYLPRNARLKKKARRVQSNARFKKIENDDKLKRYVVKKLKKY